MPELPPFQQKQYAFAAHIRDPEHNPAPAGIEDRRMGIYRDLFFNNIQSLLGKNFPVVKKICSRQRWRSLIRDFMISHRARTPYFLELPREFLVFLEQRPQPDDLPFLKELAHYEWVELALSISAARDEPGAFDPDGDLLEGVPAISALAWPLAYRFPVHRISKKFQPREPGELPTYLVVFRKPDLSVGFMELNAVTAGLLRKIAENREGKTGRELLLVLAGETEFEATALIEHGAKALEDLRRAGILIGTRNREWM